MSLITFKRFPVPFQGTALSFTQSQGAALGWYPMPLRGEYCATDQIENALGKSSYGTAPALVKSSGIAD